MTVPAEAITAAAKAMEDAVYEWDGVSVLTDAATAAPLIAAAERIVEFLRLAGYDIAADNLENPLVLG